MHAPSLSEDRTHDALKGIRVLDFTAVMSGPLSSRALADAGADVIKVESPNGDLVRHRPPLRSGISAYFGAMNCGKRGIVLDLATPEGKEIALRLAAKADIVVENFRPGVMKKLELDYETLSAGNPRLIYCSISGFGQTGALAHAPAYAPVIHALSGYELAYASYQRTAERPANNGIFVADVLAAANAASAMHLALYDREKTGRGQHIDVALLDSMLSMLVYEAQVAQYPTGRARQVYEPVRAKDGFVMVAANTAKNMEALYRLLGFPEGKTDPRFATLAKKEENWNALLEIIEGWTSQHTAAECEELMMKAGVPCARYRTVKEAMDDPHVQQRGTFCKVGTDDEPFLVANQPYRMSGARIEARQSLPQKGQHTDEVLKEMLGFDRPELDRLHMAGAFGKP